MTLNTFEPGLVRLHLSKPLIWYQTWHVLDNFEFWPYFWAWPTLTLTFDPDDYKYFRNRFSYIALVKPFHLIPNLTYFGQFLMLTSFFGRDLLWPWPLTYLGIFHLGYDPNFFPMVNTYHHANFHAFFTFWTIFTIPKPTNWIYSRADNVWHEIEQ